MILIWRFTNFRPAFRFRLDLAKALTEAGSYDEAQKQYETILSQQPDFPPALGDLGALYVKQGKLDQVADFLKRVHDAGLPAGISTHMPAVVDTVESKGWELDYYMTCVYERHRSAADLKKLLGHVPLPVGEVFLQSDPPRMFKAIQQTRRTCLAFKILAGGRRTVVEQAFRETFAGIKPTDAVVPSRPARNNASASPRTGSRRLLSGRLPQYPKGSLGPLALFHRTCELCHGNFLRIGASSPAHNEGALGPTRPWTTSSVRAV